VWLSQRPDNPSADRRWGPGPVGAEVRGVITAIVPDRSTCLLRLRRQRSFCHEIYVLIL